MSGIGKLTDHEVREQESNTQSFGKLIRHEAKVHKFPPKRIGDHDKCGLHRMSGGRNGHICGQTVESLDIAPWRAGMNMAGTTFL